MTAILLALLLGAVAGLRTFMAPTAASWAMHSGWLSPGGTWLAFLGNPWTRWALTVLAAGELIADKLSSTPSRTVPVQFGARLASGGLSGAAIGAGAGAIPGGLIAGVLGAILGTIEGRAVRGRLAVAFHRDPPAALLEDAFALVTALLVCLAAR